MLILEGGSVMVGHFFERGVTEFFAEMKKMQNHSIKNKYSNML